jgi:hypothetical protein
MFIIFGFKILCAIKVHLDTQLNQFYLRLLTIVCGLLLFHCCRRASGLCNSTHVCTGCERWWQYTVVTW